jgi:aminoglycoside phosphotransferase (APT) family kinase protein
MTSASAAPSSALLANRHAYSELMAIFRRELVDDVRPELNTPYALYVVDVMCLMLDNLQDWLGGKPYAEVDALRREMLALAPSLSPDADLASDLDDETGSDALVERLFEQARESGDKDRIARLSATICRTFETLYADQGERQQTSRKDQDALLAQIDIELTPERVERFARERMPGHDSAVSRVTKVPGGNSKDTFLVTFSGGAEWIVRRDFPFGPVDTSAPDEFGLLQKLHEAGMPVPRPIAAERDPGFFGQPFLVVEKLAGSNAEDVAKADPAVGRAASLELARLLATLHAFDPRALGVAVSASSASEQVRAYIAEWKSWWERHRLHPNSLVTAGFAWLEDNIPQEIARIVTVHGDPRPANMLIDNGRVSALLDWEFVHAGDPAEDLQYAKGFVEPFLSWEEFRDAYRDAGGAPFSEAGERFYDIFRSLRNSTKHRSIRGS